MPEYDDEPGDMQDDEPFERPRRSPIAYAKERVRAPAVTMLAFAIVSLAMAPLSLLNLFMIPDMAQKQREMIDRNPRMPNDQKQAMKNFWDTYEKTVMISVPISLVLHVIGGALSVYGSLKMMRMQSYRWAIATSIVNIASVGHGCCFLTLFVGIWALMVLMNDRVKAGYAAARRKQQDNEQDQNPDDEHDRYQS